MPLAVQNLTTASNDEAVKEAISLSIEQCMGEPIPQGMTQSERRAQCAAIAYSHARDRTGKALSPHPNRRGQ